MQKLKWFPSFRRQLGSSNAVRQAKEANGTLLENITLNPKPSFGSYKLGWCSFNYSTRGWCHTQTAGMTIPSGTIVPTAGSHLISLLRSCLLPVGEALRLPG